MHFIIIIAYCRYDRFSGELREAPSFSCIELAGMVSNIAEQLCCMNATVVQSQRLLTAYHLHNNNNNNSMLLQSPSSSLSTTTTIQSLGYEVCDLVLCSSNMFYLYLILG